VLSFSQGGAKLTGPPTAIATTLTAKAGQPTPIQIWVEDPKPEYKGASESRRGGETASVATISLHKFRGPGDVTFDRGRHPVKTQGEVIAPTATFSAPGEYLLRVQANDESGEGGAGFQCCWTNTYVKVTVQ
jgi:hypothetical protein